MAEGRASATALWALRLLMRRSAWRGTQIARTLNVLTSILLVTGAGGIVALAIPSTRTWILGARQSIPFWASAAAWLVMAVVGGFLARYLSDAARYLTPRPANISSRAAIRDEGIALLDRIHASGQYARVVVIGHSLGSVIAYDILRFYWDQSRRPVASKAARQPVLHEFELATQRFPDSPTEAQLDQFQQLQHRLWREQRSLGVPWLVTDLITLGSPLTNAPMLLGDKNANVVQLKRERELPSCPPTGDGGENVAGFYRANVSGADGDDRMIVRSLACGDSGAVFATTRWTNLYFPVRRLILGDLVGGPIAPAFGPGIRDIPVRTSPLSRRLAWLQNIFPVPHVSYWAASAPAALTRQQRRADNRRLGTRESMPTLQHVIGLDILRSRTPYPDPDPARAAMGPPEQGR